MCNPSALTKKSVASCDAVLVDVTGPAIEKLVADNSYCRKATIAGGMYSSNSEGVKTVFEKFDDFKELHPADPPLLCRGSGLSALSGAEKLTAPCQLFGPGGPLNERAPPVRNAAGLSIIY